MYTINYDRDWTWINFEHKPTRSILDALKSLGFRWSRKRASWYARQRVAAATLRDAIGDAPAKASDARQAGSKGERRAADWRQLVMMGNQRTTFKRAYIELSQFIHSECRLDLELPPVNVMLNATGKLPRARKNAVLSVSKMHADRVTFARLFGGGKWYSADVRDVAQWIDTLPVIEKRTPDGKTPLNITPAVEQWARDCLKWIYCDRSGDDPRHAFPG